MAGKTKQHKAQLSVIVETTLSGCIKRANEMGITKEEFAGIYPLQSTFVLVYYR